MCFNTSHVSINQPKHFLTTPLEHFNTSHVSINHQRRCIPTEYLSISIHPMFLLIPSRSIRSQSFWDFNTSHVSINRQVSIWGTHPEMISIHPMFLLIVRRLMRRSLPRKISIHPMFLLIRHGACKHGGRSLISIHPMFLLIWIFHNWYISKSNFNTSHVSINPARRLQTANRGVFQYIPCFY